MAKTATSDAADKITTAKEKTAKKPAAQKTAAKKTTKKTTKKIEPPKKAPAKKAPVKQAVKKPTVSKPVITPKAIIAAVPNLQTGEWLPLGDVAKILHDKKLLAKSATSTKLLRKFPEHFELGRLLGG